MRVCVTGASGLIGSAVCRRLVSDGHDVIGISRQPFHGKFPENVRPLEGDLVVDDNLVESLTPLDWVVHAAGRAHVLREKMNRSANEYYLSNVMATEKLALSSCRAGVKRFVFISSLSVHEGVFTDREFITESSPIVPQSLYAQSKMEAEQRLLTVAKSSGMDTVIIRPALVVGSGAPGNLRRLARLISANIILPVSSQDNLRAYIALDNLVELILLCLTHINAPGETFLAAEHELLSTRKVISLISEGMRKQTRTLLLPHSFIKNIAFLIGKPDLFEKLYGNLLVDASKARNVLGWSSISTIEDAFRALGASYARA